MAQTSTLRELFREQTGVNSKDGIEQILLNNNSAYIHWLEQTIETRDKTIGTVLQSYQHALVAMQSSYIAGIKDGAETGMAWLYSYMLGPDILPSDEDIEMGADAYRDKHSKLPDFE
jgi:hypothetical protein